jgi:hypothetical protein
LNLVGSLHTTETDRDTGISLQTDVPCFSATCFSSHLKNLNCFYQIMTGQSSISITHVLLALYLPAPTYCFSVWIPLFPKYPFPLHNSPTISGYEPDLSYTIIKNQFHILTFSSSNQYAGFRGNGTKVRLKTFLMNISFVECYFLVCEYFNTCTKNHTQRFYTEKIWSYVIWICWV